MDSPSAKRPKILRQSSLLDLLEVKSKETDFKESAKQRKDTNSQLRKSSSSSSLPDSVAEASRQLFSEKEEPTMAECVDDMIDDLEDELTLESSPRQEELASEYGSPLHEFSYGPSTYPTLPPLQESFRHCVTIHSQLPNSAPPRPFPDSFRDVWDSNHVRMPCSRKCLYPIAGVDKLSSKWDLIVQCLRRPIRNAGELVEAILGYNARQRGKWNFDALVVFFTDPCNKEGTDAFFNVVFPRLVDLTLSLPNIVTHAVPLLKQQQDYAITISQKQAACLLANAFLCTFPYRNSTKHTAEYSNFPLINFNTLFRGPLTGRKEGKLRCIIHYFDRVTSRMPTGTVTYHRQVLRDRPNWEKCPDKLTKLHTSAVRMIEDVGVGMLQVDFANRFMGGGVLGHGCVQEEIRFAICPELIVSRLFTEALADNESLIVMGFEQYSSYRGYADTFKFAGNYKDETVRDSWGRRQTQLVAIDALVFKAKPQEQFSARLRLRELNKAYCGFHCCDPPGPSGAFPAVATGNWGCGAFGGNIELKALLQLLAAARAKRDVVYTTFGNRQFAHDLCEIHELLTRSSCTVAQVWSLVAQYAAQKERDGLFQFIRSQLNKDRPHNQPLGQT